MKYEGAILSEQPLRDHRVPHVLEDADHWLKVMLRVIMLRCAVVGVLLREIFNARAVDVERDTIMATVHAGLVRVVASELLAREHVGIPTVIRSRDMERLFCQALHHRKGR